MTRIESSRRSAGAVAAAIEELSGGAAERQPVKRSDSLSGSTVEWVDVHGERCLIKHLCVDDDWILRATGDLGIRQVELWRRGLFDRLPECLDSALLGGAAGRREGGRGYAALVL